MKNKTKKYRGGNTEYLNEEFFMSKLKEILNQRPLKYKFDIKKNTHYGKTTFDVFIENPDEITRSYNSDDEPCLSLYLYNSIEGTSIAINMLNKCIPINNYGNYMINSLKEFATEYRYYSIIIPSDGSTLDFRFNENGVKKNIYLELAILSILSTGESWYNKRGFYTPINREQIQDNTYKIRQDIGDIDEPSKIITFIDDNLKPYKNRPNKTPICFRMVNSYGKFRELYNFILDLTKKTDTNSVQEVFQEINNIIKMNCDTNTNTCKIDYETMLKIDCFIMFMYNLLDIKYKATSLIYIVPKSNNNITPSSGGKYLRKNIRRKSKRKSKKLYNR